MTTPATGSTNVSDFISYKLQRIIKKFQRAGRHDIANALDDALQRYAKGEIELTFVDNWPHIVKEKQRN